MEIYINILKKNADGQPYLPVYVLKNIDDFSNLQRSYTFSDKVNKILYFVNRERTEDILFTNFKRKNIDGVFLDDIDYTVDGQTINYTVGGVYQGYLALYYIKELIDFDNIFNFLLENYPVYLVYFAHQDVVHRALLYTGNFITSPDEVSDRDAVHYYGIYGLSENWINNETEKTKVYDKFKEYYDAAVQLL